MAYKTTKLSKRTELEHCRDFVMKRFNASDKYTQGYFTRFQEYYKLYRSYQERGKLPWRSNLFIPKTFEIIETIAPRIAYAQKTFIARPVEGGDVDNAEAFSDLLKYQFERTNMEDVIEELVKETLIYGTGIVKVSWKDNMPYPEVVDIFDFFPDPKARSDAELNYAIHRVQRDMIDLRKNPNYDPKALDRLEKAGASVDDTQERRQRLGIIGVTSSDNSRTRYEVIEYHGEYEGEMYIITVVGDEVLRKDKSPYGKIPFVVVNDHRVPHELYGIGEIEPIESLQNELNDIRNQRLDNVKLAINKMWGVVAGGVQFEDELVSRPGGVIHLTRPDALPELGWRPVDSTSFTEEAVIKSDAERATGANSPLSGALVSPMGGTQGGVMNRTATGFQGAINQADKRFIAKVNQIKRGLIRIGRLFLDFDQLFMTKEQAVRVLGESGQEIIVPVTPEDIRGNYDLTIDVEYLDEFQRQQADAQVAQAMSQVPGFDVASFMVDSLERNGRKDVKKYLKEPTPPPPEPAKVNVQLKGEMAPEAVAQELQKREGIQTGEDSIEAQKNAQAIEHAQGLADVQSTQADIANTQADTQQIIEGGEDDGSTGSAGES